MSSVVANLMLLRGILKENGQEYALEKVEDVIKNIDNKEKLYYLAQSLNARDFGDLYLPIFEGDWWKILYEARTEVEKLYYMLASKEEKLEEKYLYILNELYYTVKDIDDVKMLTNLENIIKDYMNPNMIKSLIKICETQGGRPITKVSSSGQSWGELLRELKNKANAYLIKVENKDDIKIEKYIAELKQECKNIL